MGRFCRTRLIGKLFDDCTAVSFVTPFWLRYNSRNLNNINYCASPKTQPQVDERPYPSILARLRLARLVNKPNSTRQVGTLGDTMRVLITGAAVRLGRAIAFELAGAGDNILIHYRKSSRESKSLQKELKSLL